MKWAQCIMFSLFGYFLGIAHSFKTCFLHIRMEEHSRQLCSQYVQGKAFEFCLKCVITIRGQWNPLNLWLNLVEYAKSRKSAARNSRRGAVRKAAAADAAKHTKHKKDRA